MKIVNLIPRAPRRASVLPSADMHVAGGSGVIAGRGEPGTVGGEKIGNWGSNVTPMRSRAAPFLAIAVLIGAGGCASTPKIDPLTVRQIEPARAAPADPTMALISGRLLIAEDGKSKVPYESGTDAGCVAGTTAALVVLIPVMLFLGGAPTVAGGPDCETYLPTMTLVQLESRRAAALVVAEDGRFQAQVPPGTYLVQGVTDDRTPLSVAMAFQSPAPGHSYYLGDAQLSYASGWGETNTPSVDVRDSQAGTVNDATPSPERALLIRLDQFKSAQELYGSDADKKWNAYLASIIAELDAKGMRLLTATASSVEPQSREALAASFDQRRREIEARWATRIAEKRKRHCTSYGAAPPCFVVREDEAARDAELQALDEERRLTLGSN